MKRLFFLLLISFALTSCGQDGKAIEVQETSSGKFVVIDENDSEDSYVVIHYLNGEIKTMDFAQAQSVMNQNPPSPPNSQVFNNYDGGYNHGGISFSDLMLYHMMFGGVGGHYNQTVIVNRYPTYRNIRPSVNINYAAKASNFSSRNSNGWKNTRPISKPNAFSSSRSRSFSKPSAFSSGPSKSYSKPNAFSSSPSRSYSKPSAFSSSPSKSYSKPSAFSGSSSRSSFSRSSSSFGRKR